MPDKQPPRVPDEGLNFGTGSAPRKRPFVFHPANLILLVVSAIGWGLLIYWQSKQGMTANPYMIGRSVGAFGGCFFWAGFLAFVAFYVARRSSRTGNIVFSLVFLVFFVDNSAKLLNRAQASRPVKTENLNAARATLDRTIEDARQQYNETGETSGSVESLGRMAAAYEAASRGTGSEAKAASFLAKFFHMLKKRHHPHAGQRRPCQQWRRIRAGLDHQSG